MRKPSAGMVVVIAGLALMGACGSGKQMENAAAGAPKAAPDAVVADARCDWGKSLGGQTDPNAPAKEFTQASVDEAVAASPSEIRPDTKIVMQAAFDAQEVGKQIQGLPPEQAAQKSMEAMSAMSSPEYGRAMGNIFKHVRKHCPGLAKEMQKGLDALNALNE